MEKLVDEHRAYEKFPIGMRVLAIDDDPICLKVLEQMLRKCEYEVRTTDRATKALTILRENGGRFDLIITDVNMPDMDGFEFVEHVGLALDLPVVILSAHSDKELVMKGVIHGAFDYLLKPVRMEELRNIWQHVFRKKVCLMDRRKALLQDKAQGAPDDIVRATILNSADDRSANGTMISTEQGEDDDQVENAPENNDPSTQKKPRVVWCIDLHRKFVAAVKQLGIEKAVPKKILELMNVEGLTRENVASHLQKYRQYLKRLQSEDQAHLFAPLAARDSGSYMRMASLDVYHQDFHSFSGPGRLPITSPPGGSFGRLNSLSALSYHGIGSSGLLFQGQTQSLSSSNTLGRIRLPVLFTNPSSNLPEGVPNSLKINQLPQIVISRRNQVSPIVDSVGFTVPAQFPGSGGDSIGSSNNALMCQVNTQKPHDLGLGTYGSGSCNWRAAAGSLPQLPSNSLSFGDPFLDEQPNLSGLHISSSSPPKEKSLFEFPPADTVSVLPEDSRRGSQCRDGLLGDVVQATTGMAKQSWEENKQDNQNSSLPFKITSSMVSSAGAALGSFGQYSQQPNAFCSNKSDASLTGQRNEATPSMQSSDAGTLSTDADMKQNDGFVPNDLEPVDNLMSMVPERA